MLINDFFISQCISACVSIKGNEKQANDILDSIYYILKWVKKETPKEKFPTELSETYDLALYLSKYRKQNREFDFNILVSGIEGGRFSNFVDSLNAKKRDYTDVDLSKLSSFIYNKRKLCELTSGRKILETKLNELDSGSFDDDADALTSWETMINQLNTQLMEVKKMESVEDMSFLDIMEDDYGPVMEKLRNQSDEEGSLKTGYTFFADNFPAKGFEPCRFYLIGGTSGVGKSTILVNFLGNAALHSPYIKEGEKRDVLLYVTAENLIDESLERLYCMLTGESIDIVKRKYTDPTFTLKTELNKILGKKKVTIQIVYVQPKKTTVQQLEAIMDKVAASGYNVTGLFLDYLDLIRSGYNLTELRHELGEVTMGLKNLAVTYRIPIVSVTQLNRSGYDKKVEAGAIQMSESMQKVDNSDTVIMIQEDNNEPTISIPGKGGLPITCKNLKIRIIKNRNGRKGDSTNMIMKDKIGSQSVFNFRIEEKTMIRDEQQIQNSNEPSVLTLGTF